MRDTINTSVYLPVDITIQGDSCLDNPFFVDVRGVFSGPNGESMVIPGFYNGRSWIVRFSPTTPGEWIYRIISQHLTLDGAEGTVRVGENGNGNIHGRLLINPSHPHHFVYEDGTPYFLFAYEADWLWAPGLGDPEIVKVRELIDQIKDYGFNHILVNVYAHDCTWRSGKTSDRDYGPPDLYAWEGSNEKPDHSRLNSFFFENFDRMMRYLLENGIVAHIMYKVYNKMVNWPERNSPEEDLYFRYVTARYQAFPNVLWSFAKESKNEPDKAYLANRIHYVCALDAYEHPITTHDDQIFYAAEDWNRTIDFCTLQIHDEFYLSALREREKRAWPIFNSEFGYEHGPGGPEDLTYRVGQCPEELIRRAYDVVMAGAYPAYYYTYTAWDVIDYSHVPPGYGYFKILYDLFTSLEWWNLQPHPEFCKGPARCLAIPGRQYLFYLKEPSDRRAHIMARVDALSEYTGFFMNIYTGERTKADIREIFMARGNGLYRLEAPLTSYGSDPFVLYMSKEGG